MTAKTEQMNRIHTTSCLYMAMELGSTKWVLAFSDESGQKIRRRTVSAGDLVALDQELLSARRRLGLPGEGPVRSCYEAGRDGFWVHRELEARGIESLVIDSASMERARGRRPKTDRIDAAKLLLNLRRHHRGERVWSVCRVPTEQQEDERRNEREMARLKKERSSLTNAIKSGLALYGIPWGTKKFPDSFDELRRPNGEPLPRFRLAELNRALGRRRGIEQDIATVEQERAEWCERGGSVRAARLAAGLMLLKGIGKNFAWTMTLEILNWRSFQRGREVGAAVGLVPTPWLSDKCVDKELGVSKTGSPRVRAMLVEIAWLWLRYQPDTELSRWFNERFGSSGKRSRRIGIVALARKLAIRLWSYAEHGVVPHGAVFKGEGSSEAKAFRQVMATT